MHSVLSLLDRPRSSSTVVKPHHRKCQSAVGSGATRERFRWWGFTFGAACGFILAPVHSSCRKNITLKNAHLGALHTTHNTEVHSTEAGVQYTFSSHCQYSPDTTRHASDRAASSVRMRMHHTAIYCVNLHTVCRVGRRDRNLFVYSHRWGFRGYKLGDFCCSTRVK